MHWEAQHLTSEFSQNGRTWLHSEYEIFCPLSFLSFHHNVYWLPVWWTKKVFRREAKLTSAYFGHLHIYNAVFWDVSPCRFCVYRRFGGTYRLHLQGRKIRERGTSVSHVAHAICSSETSIYTKSTRRHIPEDGILHTHNRENLKSYMVIFSAPFLLVSV
jgi:hypothetical protein